MIMAYGIFYFSYTANLLRNFNLFQTRLVCFIKKPCLQTKEALIAMQTRLLFNTIISM